MWKVIQMDTGALTPETRSALEFITWGLIEVFCYCLGKLGFHYVLLGKFQTDCLEVWFGKYRQLAGSQYHISVIQVLECENKLRLQQALVLPYMHDMMAVSAVSELDGKELL